MTADRRPAPPGRAVLEVVTVPADAAPMRLDRAAATLLTAFPTRASARKAARRGELAVDSEISEGARWVAPGHQIAWLEPEGARVPPLRIRIPIVHEDDDLAVVIKPGGLATNGPRARTLERALPFNLDRSTAADALQRPRPVHRLDAPTAGLVVVAKTRTALADLGWQFQHREVHKRYRAVVVGPLQGEGAVDQPIEGRPALTRYRVLAVGRSLHGGWISRVDAWPQTGRTHQIRRHLAFLGTPVLGDAAYGREGLILRRKGLLLFALELGLRHPTTGDPLHLTMAEPGKVAALFAREARRWVRVHGGPSGPHATGRVG